MHTLKHRALTLLAVLALGGAACQGDKGTPGDTGPAGATGSTGAAGDKGAQGAPGVVTGIVTGTLDYKPDGTTSFPATGVTVSTIPDAGVTASTDSSGKFTLTAPIGVYSIQFAGNGFQTAKVDSVSVVAAANASATIVKTLVHLVPFAIQPGNVPNPAGFNRNVTLAPVITVNGQAIADPVAAGYTFAWSFVKGPTTVATSATTPTLGVSIPKLSDIAAAKALVGFPTSFRAGLVGVSYQQMLDMTYQYKVTVTDSQKFTTSATIGVSPAMWTAGNSNMAPIGVPLIAASSAADVGLNWTLTAPAGSAAALDDKVSENPVFTPDITGVYTLTRGSTAITVAAGRYEGTSPNCGACHPQSTATKVAAIWAKYNASAHGTTDITSAGLDGAEGAYFSSDCLTCHTVGYNKLAANGGFDDVAAANGWTWPTKLQPGNAAAMPAALQKMNKVQCESCHGPIGAHEGLFQSNGVVPKGEYAAKTCAQCHDELPYADRYQLWSQSAHANLAVAVSEGPGTLSNSCNRCHTAQGFVQYVKQLTGQFNDVNGNPVVFQGVLLDPSATPTAPATVAAAGGPFLTSLGITPNAVEPQTCQACHDPHTTAVRFSGDTPMLPGGFQVKGAGAGALCFVCHNSRNGARNDFAPVVAGKPQFFNNDLPGAVPAPLTSIGGPHEANQGDVVAGANAFFMPAFNPSRHLAVADTCVGCHVKIIPDGVKAASTNHTFAADLTICKSCHNSAEVDGEGLQGQFDAAVADLAAAIQSTSQTAMVTAGPTAGEFAIKGSSRTVVIPATTTIASIAFVSGRSPGFIFTFSAAINDPNAASGTVAAGTAVGTTSAPIALGNVFKTDGAGNATTTKLFDVLAGRIAKANWNYSLVTQDGSKSIHNPTFVFGVLGNTKNAILSGSGAL